MSHNINKVNSVKPNREGNISQNSDDIVAARNGTNYTAANTDSITTHLAGIDTALANSGGGETVPSFTILQNQSSSYTITDTSASRRIYIVTPTANIDVILPSVSSAGSGTMYDIKNMSSSFTLTLKGQTGENIDNVPPATGVVIGTQNESLTVITNGTEWYII